MENSTPQPPASPEAWTAQYINSLHSHHVTITYFFVAIVAALILSIGFGGYCGLAAYEKLEAKAEAQEERYDADRKTFYDTLAQHDADRAANDAKQAQLVAGIAARAKEAPAPVVQQGLKPDAGSEEVKNALNAVLSPRHPGMAPVEVQGEILALTPTAAQNVLGDEVLLTRTLADLGDTSKVLELEKQTNSSLTSDLTQCKATNAEADKTIALFKKAAIKSKWQKIKDGMKQGALLIAGIGLGRAIK